ncbi:MAG TPA: type I 3-dehydroquinate dehydratase [Thermoplasmata archaeon]|nr:type I 3-dehydroquinate dehydratase [Thermoplasmata archaeon]
MNRSTRIAVTLPSRSVEEARRETRLARAGGADFAEIRLDRWTPADRDRIRELFPSPLPLIGTLRSAAEGGEGPDDPRERRATLEHLAASPFAFIDYELARDYLPDSFRSGPASIGSRHFPAGATGSDVQSFVSSAPATCAFVKAILPLSVGEFRHDLLPRYPGWANGRTVVATTGPSGPLSRLWANRLRQPLVFASLPTDVEDPPVDPAQIPVDELRRGWSATPLRGYAVVGRPVAHSLSPRIHAGWSATHRHRTAFVALELGTRPEFEETIASARDGEWAGWSVTHPWKEAAASVADERSESVQSTGVANTLTFRDGKVRADLTDASAVTRRARELKRSNRWDGREALVVGSGGAARAAVFGLRPVAVRALLVGRSPARVAELVQRVGGTPARVEDRHPVGLLVHATTVGRPGAGRLDPPLAGWIDSGTTVLDFVYSASDAQIRTECEAAGGTYEDGRRLLVYQAADAHADWWGHRPTEQELETMLRRIGCAE